MSIKETEMSVRCAGSEGEKSFPRLDRFSVANVRRARRIAAFTLIELLIVIGIISLLLGILLTSMARARQAANEIACASILRQWGQAFQIYSSDYKGIIPHSGDETRNPFFYQNKYDPAATQNESCYINVLPPLMGQPAWSSFPAGKQPTTDIWQCPLAQILPDSAYGYQPSIYGYHSYAMNEFLDNTPPAYPYFFNMSKAKSSSVTLLMYEITLNPSQCFGQNPIPVACYVGYYPDESPRALGDRHPHQKGQLGGNLLMLDGHIEWTNSLWDKTLANPDAPPMTNRTWWPY
jgi:prepilin-type N-terminal cleavage/methylation domain-containing protein/prepilin-type processing-associated H-X9-DG protein